MNLSQDSLLVKLREGKKRSKVAKDLGITPQGLGMIERGERIPRPNLMKKIADYYKKSIDEIFFSCIDTKRIKKS